MNKQRREKISIGVKKLNEVLDIFQDVLSDEEAAFDNLSDGLQQTSRGESMEDNIDILNSSIDSINDILDDIQDIE